MTIEQHPSASGNIALTDAGRERSARFWWAVTAFFLGLAFVSRLPIFGNPIVHVDEQFYLLVGQRLAHGFLPYVDVWDRKPIGLFLLFAGMSRLGGDGVVAYQVVATVFAAATAMAICRAAREFGTRTAAIGAGSIYLTWLNLGAAGGGQSPLFYNLPMTVAGLLTLRAVLDRLRPFPNLATAGAAIMLLVGLAIQIKYTALFEGAFFGIYLLALTWRAERSLARVALCATWWSSVAIAPTILAWLVYAAGGHGPEFVFANFTSVFLRGGSSPGELVARLAQMGLVLSPFAICAALPLSDTDDATTVAQRFVRRWLLAAAGGVLIFGTYFAHYVLPVLVPGALACVPVFSRRHGTRLAAGMIGSSLLAGLIVLVITQRHNGTPDQFSRLAVAVDPLGCVFVYSGEPAFYLLAPPCPPARFLLPSHLSRLRDASAIGVDPVAEVTRIMAATPTTVVIRQPFDDENFAARRIVETSLRTRYRQVATGPLGKEMVSIFRRRPGYDRTAHLRQPATKQATALLDDSQPPR